MKLPSRDQTLFVLGVTGMVYEALIGHDVQFFLGFAGLTAAPAFLRADERRK